MWRQFFISLLISLCSLILLTGCVASMLGKQPAQSFSEQLYIDARLDFAIKHPLDWQLLKTPVSSPQYREDTVRWLVKDMQQERGNGEMLIRSRPTDPELTLTELLDLHLAKEIEEKDRQLEELILPAGSALKLTEHDDEQGRMIIALKGQARDFIISLVCPSSRFAELLPIFQDLVKSFVEVTNPTEQPN